MRVLTNKNKTAHIIHPNDADVSIKVKKLNRADAMEFANDVKESRTIKAIMVGEEILRDPKTGKIETYNGDDEFPLAAVTKMFRKIYVPGSATGIIDEAGNPVEVTLENIEVLLDESLDVAVENATMPFWMYVFDQIRRKETFGDPNEQR